MSKSTAKLNAMLEAAQALFRGQIQSLVAITFENERPFCGLAGVLDWYFHGAISKCVLAGAITGKIGECVYFPVTRNGSTYHVILAGAGLSQAPGKRGPVPPKTLQVLHNNLLLLKLGQSKVPPHPADGSKVGISRSDFGRVNDDYFTKHLEGIPLWITP